MPARLGTSLVGMSRLGMTLERKRIAMAGFSKLAVDSSVNNT
jgi:hypothetical protein